MADTLVFEAIVIISCVYNRKNKFDFLQILLYFSLKNTIMNGVFIKFSVRYWLYQGFRKTNMYFLSLSILTKMIKV